MTRTRITVEDVAADPTNAYEVTVHGDVAIETLTIHGDEGGHGWVYVQYANGGSSAGCPKHWASYVRITEDEDDTHKAVREIYGDGAAALLDEGWTVDGAIAHVTGTCDIDICTGNHELPPSPPRFVPTPAEYEAATQRHEMMVTVWSFGRVVLYCNTCGWHHKFTDEEYTRPSATDSGVKLDALNAATLAHDDDVRNGASD